MIADKNSSQTNGNKNDKKISKCSFGSFEGYIYAIIAATCYCIGQTILKLDNDLSSTDHLSIFYGIQLIIMIGKYHFYQIILWTHIKYDQKKSYEQSSRLFRKKKNIQNCVGIAQGNPVK